MVLLLALAALLINDHDEKTDAFVIAAENEVFTLDPQRMSWLGDMRVAYALYEGLVRWNPEDFSIQPAVAQTWEIADDGLTYRFTLDPDAKWSDGSPVTAHDFVWSWQRLLMPDTASDYSGLMLAVEGGPEFMAWRSRALKAFQPGPGNAEALMAETEDRFDHMVGLKAEDNHTLTVRLRHPVPYFLDLLAFAPLLPVHRPSVEGWPIDEAPDWIPDGWHTNDPPPWSARRLMTLSSETGRIQPDHRWARPGTLISNGPYVLSRWRYRRDLLLDRNPYERNPAPDRVSQILIRSIPDPNTALLAFRAGEVDWLTGVSADARSDLLDEARAQPNSEDRLVKSIRAIPAFGTDFFSFNCRESLPSGVANPFHDAAVRRAFALATDKQGIVDHVTGLSEPIAGSMTPPGSIAGYTPPRGLGFDPDQAMQELKDAGWSLNASGQLCDVKGDPFPPVELLYTTSSARHRRIAAALRDQWRQRLGVDVILVGKDSNAFGEDLKQGNFMMARGRWYGDWGDPSTFLELFRTGDGNNDRGFSNAEIDARLEMAAAELDHASRLAQLASIERDLFEKHMPLLPICQIVEVTMHDPDRHIGMTSHPRLVQYLGDVRVQEVDRP